MQFLYNKMTSPEAFQKKVWSWMEEKGILTKLKIQLRQQMINVLKGTDLEQDVTSDIKLKMRLSPKYKAINLLIAEYLLQQGYQYTLSIFTTEDPTISLIEERQTTEKNSDKNIFAFTDDDVYDIMESLGFSRDISEIRDICQLYKETSIDSLLICLFRCIPYKTNKIKSHNHSNESTTIKHSVVSTQTYDYLDKNENNSDDKQNLEKEMQNLFNKELEMATIAEQAKYQQLIEFNKLQMKSELHKEKDKLKKRENKFRLRLLKEFKFEQEKLMERERLKEIRIENELHRDLEFERRKLIEEFQMRSHNDNANFKSLAELQQSSLEIAMKAVQHQSNKLRKKEDLLNNKLSELSKNNVNNKMKDSSCQTDTDNKTTNKCECYKHNCIICVNKNIKYVDKEIQTCYNICAGNHSSSQNKIKTENKALNKEIQTSTVDSVSKESQTYAIENLNKCNQTSKSMTFSTGCQTLDTKPESSQNLKNTNQNVIEYFTDKKIQTDKLSDQDPINLISIGNDKKISTNVKNVLKELHNENIYFKAYNEQQRLHIEELTKKYAMLNNEIRKPYVQKAEKYDVKMNIPNPCVGSNSNSSKECYKYVCDDKDGFSSDDLGIDAIKDTLQKLEREGEELEKSYCKFKKRQSESIRSPTKKYSSQINLSSTIFQDDECYKSLPCMYSPNRYTHTKDFSKMRNICNLKDEQTFSSDYLDRNFIDKYDSIKFNRTRRVQESAMNLDANIFQNYLIASRDVKQYNIKNPKLFGDMLIHRNYDAKFLKPHSSIDANKLHSNQRRMLLDTSKYKNVRKYYINDDHNKNEVLTCNSNNKYRRWSLPSAIYRKSPLSHKERISVSEERHNETISIKDDHDKSIQNELIIKDVRKKLNFVNLTENNKIADNTIDDVVTETRTKDDLDLDLEDIAISKCESIKIHNASDICIPSPVSKQDLKIDRSNSITDSIIASENLEKVKVTELPQSITENINVVEQLDPKEPNNVSKITKHEQVTILDAIDNQESQDDNIEIGFSQNIASEVNHLDIKMDLVSDIGKDDNVCNNDKSEEVSTTSEEVIVPSSLEISDHSHISVPHVSDDNNDDSFWK